MVLLASSFHQEAGRAGPHGEATTAWNLLSEPGMHSTEVDIMMGTRLMHTCRDCHGFLVPARKGNHQAAIAQLGERQTEDLKVPGSIPGLGIASILSPASHSVDEHAKAGSEADATDMREDVEDKHAACKECTCRLQHKTTPVGFEPTRGDPIGLAGRRLNHSAKVSSAQRCPSHAKWLSSAANA